VTPRGSQPIYADRIARREVNLFADHSQIVQLEAHRSGIRGTKST
jgi:phosphosulfolactate synthase (CoM biosynthesis protein A)